MIKTFKTFASLVLFTCMLSLWVSCFFVPAETQFGSELSKLDGGWTHFIAISWVFIAAELQQKSTATKSTSSAPVNLMEKLTWKILANKRPLHVRSDKIIIPRRRFLTNPKKSAGLRVSFAPDKKLESHRFIKHLNDMNQDEIGECYERRYASTEFMEKKNMEVEWEREFEVFPSDENCVTKQVHNRSMKEKDKFVLVLRDKHFELSPSKHFSPYDMMYEMTNQLFTEETFFIGEAGELCHPTYWSPFCTTVLPDLRREQVVPPGFSSWDAYEKYLQEYHIFYQKFIKWYDNYFCGVPVVLLADIYGNGDALTTEIFSDNEEEEEEVVDDGEAAVAVADEEEEEEVVDEKEKEEEEVLDEKEKEEEKEEEEAVVDDEEEECELENLLSVPPPRRERKWKTFGPCNRTRPHLVRKCKENVRYSK